jgi:hypothetical protein
MRNPNPELSAHEWEWHIEEHRKERTESGFYLIDGISSAGFYSHVLGCLPPIFSAETPARYEVLSIRIMEAS